MLANVEGHRVGDAAVRPARCTRWVDDIDLAGRVGADEVNILRVHDEAEIGVTAIVAKVGRLGGVGAMFVEDLRAEHLREEARAVDVDLVGRSGIDDHRSAGSSPAGCPAAALRATPLRHRAARPQRASPG